MLKLTYEFKSEEEMLAFLATRNSTLPTPAVTDDNDDTDSGETPTRDDVDADGMPYDPEVHSDPPTFTAKGLWRARKGRADEANAARDAFKANGGNEAPPADIETREAPAPAAPAPAAPAPAAPAPAAPAPAAPAPAVAAPTPAPAAPAPAAAVREPVTIDQLFTKISEMLEAGAIERTRLFDLYRSCTGLSDDDATIAVTAGPIFQVNETARAKMMDELEAI